MNAIKLFLLIFCLFLINNISFSLSLNDSYKKNHCLASKTLINQDLFVEWEADSDFNSINLPNKPTEEPYFVKIKSKKTGFAVVGNDSLKDGDWQNIDDIPLVKEGDFYVAIVPVDKNVFTINYSDNGRINHEGWTGKNVSIARVDHYSKKTKLFKTEPIDQNRMRAGGIGTIPVWYNRKKDMEKDSGIGEYTDFADSCEFMRKNFNMNVFKTLPICGAMPWQEHSPYIVSSLYALNDDWLIDWMDLETIPEMEGYDVSEYYKKGKLYEVDYKNIRDKKRIAAEEAHWLFIKNNKIKKTDRWKEFQDFKNEGIIQVGNQIIHDYHSRQFSQQIFEYAQFRAFNEILGNDYEQWMNDGINYKDPTDHPAVKKRIVEYEYFLEHYLFRQWISHKQWMNAVKKVSEKGGSIIYDIPIGEHPSGVMSWKHPQWFKKGQTMKMPGRGEEKDQDWGFLEWDWGKLKDSDFKPFIDKYLHVFRILKAGGIRADAIHMIFPWVHDEMNQGLFPKRWNPEYYQSHHTYGAEILNRLNAALDQIEAVKIAENPGPTPHTFDALGFNQTGWLTYNIRIPDWNPPYPWSSQLVCSGNHDTPRPLKIYGNEDNFINYLGWAYYHTDAVPNIIYGDWEDDLAINNPHDWDLLKQWTARNKHHGDFENQIITKLRQFSFDRMERYGYGTEEFSQSA